MSKVIQSTPLTLIDQTDSRKLEVYIKSNLPTMQIKNSNSGAFTPDWREGEGLKLSVDIFLESRVMSNNEYNSTNIKWYKNEIKSDNELKDAPTDAENISDDKKTITIGTNILDSNPIVTYICQATYQGITASSRITFARVDTGVNGAKGADGTSVKILGAAKSVAPVTGTNYYTIVYGEGAVTAAALGDAYVLHNPGDPNRHGHLFVCSSLNGGEGGVDYFVDAGPIQGEPGEPAKSIALLGSAQIFRVDKDNTPSPATISVTAHPVNLTTTEIAQITWEYREGTTGEWRSVSQNANIILNNNVARVSPSAVAETLSLRATSGVAEDIFTIHKVFDGKTGDKASIAFLTNENISFSANAEGEIDTLPIPINVVSYRGTDKVMPQIGTITDIPSGMTISVDNTTLATTSKEIILTLSVAKDSTLGSASSNHGVITIPIISPVSTSLKLSWSKINAGPTGAAGVGINKIDVAYGKSQTLTVNPENISWGATMPVVEDGWYLWTKTIIDYTDPAKQDTVTYTYAKQGDKGDTGTSIDDVTIDYAIHDNATTPPTSGWSPAIPTPTSGKRYLWTRTTFTLDDGTTTPAYSVVTQGRGVETITEWYLATNVSNGVTKTTAGWTDAIQTITDVNKYLWNYEVVSYTDGTSESTDPIVIGVYGDKGNTGNGIVSIEEWYLATSASSGVTTATTGWKNTLQPLTATNKYLWNYEIITYTNGNKVPTTPVIVGVYGDKGDQGNDAYTVLLTNESHVFAGSTSAAIASSATTQVLSYKGATSQSTTIVSVNGVAASTASTDTGIPGLSFKCSALSGTSPTITFTCTTSFVSPSGTIPIVLSVDGISITKMFTYSIAFKGATGGTGSVGPASSSYWLVSNASAVQKTSSGDILCTPATLTFTGRIQTGTSAPANYAGRWILAYSTDGSTYTDSYTSTANEATASIAASATYKAVRARMYLAGGTTTLLDEQIIPFVSDGETGAPGATGDNAVTFQVYSNNGYALSTSVPTILLQTFAYFGDVEITSGATFQWYRHNGTDWVAVSGATNDYFNVSRDDVSFSNNYMCKMQFNGTEYVGVVTIDDKNDENKVFASKPSNYFAGDLWIVSADYAPPGFTVGTMLRAEHTNTSYTDSDWVAATKYDDEIDDLRSTIDSYKQYLSVNSTNGLQIGNSSINNDVLTIDHVETSTIDAISANIESLNVVGKYSGSTMLQAPIMNLGKFSLVIESNGSFSIVVNT